ncbi:MAG: hypothetical protein H3C53_13380, partial [Trueperaceae bacterium]|nr:hypothetical protein [Trueperaceae bacterium]
MTDTVSPPTLTNERIRATSQADPGVQQAPGAGSHAALDRVLTAVARQSTYRADCVGLVPTENLLSPAARSVMASDLG